MKIKTIIDEDFTNYKLPSLFIATAYCDWKCPKELGLPITICQNSRIAQIPIFNIKKEEVYYKYKNNTITSAIVLGGLEPFLQFQEILELIDYVRKFDTISPFIIYTGYYPYELQNEINELKRYSNVIIKFGRYIPEHQKHYDTILGLELASDNQYAERIS